MTNSDVNTKSATIKLSDTQQLMLSAAAERQDRCVARPASLRGAQIAKLSTMLIAAGYVREVKAKNSAPIWRRDGETETAFALKLTAAGVRAIALERAAPARVVLTAEAGASELNPRAPQRKIPVRKAAAEKSADKNLSSTLKPIQSGLRPTSKIAAVVGLLSEAGGATLAELISATNWLPHTTRAALTGLRKRGYDLSLDRADRQRGSVYRIAVQPDHDVVGSKETAAEAA